MKGVARPERGEVAISGPLKPWQLITLHIVNMDLPPLNFLIIPDYNKFQRMKDRRAMTKNITIQSFRSRRNHFKNATASSAYLRKADASRWPRPAFRVMDITTNQKTNGYKSLNDGQSYTRLRYSTDWGISFASFVMNVYGLTNDTRDKRKNDSRAVINRW